MISDRGKGIQNLVLLCQCILVTAAFWLWFLLSYHLPIDREAIFRYAIYNVFILLGLMAGGWRAPVSAGLHSPRLEETGCQTFRQVGGTLFYLLLYLVAAHDFRISRLFLFSFTPLLYLILFVTNRSLPSFLGHLTFRRENMQKIILMGPRNKALELKGWLDKNQHLGLEILGLLTADPDPTGPPDDDTPDHRRQVVGMVTQPPSTYHQPSGNGNGHPSPPTSALSAATPMLEATRSPLPFRRTMRRAATGPTFLLDTPGPPLAAETLPILGKPEDLAEFLTAPGIVKLLMVEFPRTNGTMSHYTQLCEAHGVRLLVVADLDQIFGHPVAVFEDKGLVFIGLREESLENPISRFLKRCLDIAISLPVVLFILPPLMLVIWIAHRLQSPGPLFFIQPREGIQKRSFRVFKFRSMHTSDPLNEKRPVSKNDPRLFAFGALMRKTSLDEFPQFLNVLRGEMSVVGPRPHLVSYAENYHSICRRAYVRNFVKPGITGLARVNEARGCPETPELVTWRIQSDIEYLENWSLWLDCWLILRTAVQIFFPPKWDGMGTEVRRPKAEVRGLESGV